MKKEIKTLKAGVSFLNTTRKIDKLITELENTKTILADLEDNVSIHKQKKVKVMEKFETSLATFLGEKVGIEVIHDEAKMNYWEVETGIDREELIVKKREAIYAANRAPQKEG